MDPEKNHLFTVNGNAQQNLGASALGTVVGGSGSYFGRMVTRSQAMSYTLDNAQGATLGSVVKEGGANQARFTLLDAAGRAWVVVGMDRGLMGGITAHALGPDGRPMFSTSGNLLRHNFSIRDPAGGEVAKVHEAWVAIRDTYNVDMVGPVDPLYPLVFTILIDFEKVK